MFGFITNLFRKYPVKVQVLSKRGNVIQISGDKAGRIIDKDGTQSYHLKKHNLKIKPPEYKYFFVDKKGKPILFLYSPQQGQMFPVNVNNPPTLTIEDKETIFWGIQQIKRTHEIYPREVSIWEKYAPYFILMFTGALMLLIIFFAMPHLSATAASVASIASKLDETAKVLVGWQPPFPPGT